MKEQEAIELEMLLLKEESIRDYDMYFELRKARSARFTEIQDRLRYIDERICEESEDFTWEEPPVSKVEPIQNVRLEVQKQPLFVPKQELPTLDPPDVALNKLIDSMREEVKKDEKELPTPDSNADPYEGYKSYRQKQIRDRNVSSKYDPLKNGKFPDPDDVTEAIEEVLKGMPKPLTTKRVKREIEKRFQTNWANFSNVMRRAEHYSPYVKNVGNGRNFLWVYEHKGGNN